MVLCSLRLVGRQSSFLFIAIGIGLAGGANQPILAVVAFFIILLLLYINRSLGGKVKFRQEDKMFINITTEEEDLEQITNILTGVFTYVELKRMDSLKCGDFHGNWACFF